MNSNTLTNKQLMILEFIKEQLLSKGYPPSVREICQAVGLKSTSTVHSHLNKLEKLGYIRRDPTKPRAIEILDGGNVFSGGGPVNMAVYTLRLGGESEYIGPVGDDVYGQIMIETIIAIGVDISHLRVV